MCQQGSVYNWIILAQYSITDINFEFSAGRHWITSTQDNKLNKPFYIYNFVLACNLVLVTYRFCV